MEEPVNKNQITKSSPREYKTLEGYQIIYGTTETKFGKFLMAMKDSQICFSAFVSGIYTDLAELQNAFPKAVLLRNDSLVQETFNNYFDSDEKPPLLLTGTDFQIKIWEYLVNLPKGKLTTYKEISTNINYPKAEKSVAKAVASNKIALFVPCHKVQSRNGKYKWGYDKKLELIRHEKKYAKRNIIQLFQNHKKQIQ